jgi:hypothetical protein
LSQRENVEYLRNGFDVLKPNQLLKIWFLLISQPKEWMPLVMEGRK